jgi:hypothetical protein
MLRTCAGVVQYGGISTMTLPMGRVSTPRLAIASHTRMPARSRKLEWFARAPVFDQFDAGDEPNAVGCRRLAGSAQRDFQFLVADSAKFCRAIPGAICSVQKFQAGQVPALAPS